MEELAVCIQNSNKVESVKNTIDAIHKAGFKNVFVQYYNRDTKGLTEIEQIDYCKKLGLNIIFAHLGYSNKRPINEIWLEEKDGEEIIKNYMQDFKILSDKGIKMVVMHITDGEDGPNYNEIGLERIRKLAQYAKELNIKIAFENTRKKGYLEYVLDNIKDENIGICYDAGHCHCRFKDEFNYEFFKDRIFAVHLHDNDGSDDQHLLPFDGNINWKYVINKLKENNYNGPATLELAYRNNYMNMSLESFYREAYDRGIMLKNIYRNIDEMER